ncbi:hypothetical protein ACLOJK_030015 [Asimina triloba]
MRQKNSRQNWNLKANADGLESLDQYSVPEPDKLSPYIVHQRQCSSCSSIKQRQYIDSIKKMRKLEIHIYNAHGHGAQASPILLSGNKESTFESGRRLWIPFLRLVSPSLLFRTVVFFSGGDGQTNEK